MRCRCPSSSFSLSSLSNGGDNSDAPAIQVEGQIMRSSSSSGGGSSGSSSST
jgi:hypothetical protein